MLVTLDVFDNQSASILRIRDFSSADMIVGKKEYLLQFPGTMGQVLEFRVFWHGNCTTTVYGVRISADEQNNNAMQ